jgi:ADP-ribosylglycohydrolase
MIGAIAGDVLGSWYEANVVEGMDFPLFMKLSRITDDSVMTAAVAEALLIHGSDVSPGDFAAAMRDWGARYPDAGYGGNFRRWLTNPSQGPYNSWGNGSAMRVAPAGWLGAHAEEVLELARRSAEVSHNHIEGIKGAQAVALAVFLARQGDGRESLKREIHSRFGYDLNRTIDEIRPHYNFEISCQKSVPEAIIAALESKDFEDAVRLAISLGGDADTQGAIAGSIAEAIYGGVPEHLLAFVLPRLPWDILSLAHSFYQCYGSREMADILQSEISQRLPSDADALYSRRDRYQILLHGETRDEIQAFAEDLQAGKTQAGTRLARSLEDLPVKRWNWQWLLGSLMNSKEPCIFAESGVRGDGSDWTIRELRILGRIGMAVPVTVFDDGRHHAPDIHDNVFPATLLYIPGPLFAGGRGEPPEWNLVRRESRELDPSEYYHAIELRLLPALKYASAMAASRGVKALITVPGIGCGQFAGPFGAILPGLLEESISKLLNAYHGELPGIRALWFDPYSSGDDRRTEFGHISYLVRPLRRSSHPVPQLSHPSRFSEEHLDLSDCELFSVVAWDHVSWPGNDFWEGARSTDDGVKAAATDSMFALSGVRGRYDRGRNAYSPPGRYSRWSQIVREQRLEIRVTDNVMLISPS